MRIPSDSTTSSRGSQKPVETPLPEESKPMHAMPYSVLKAQLLSRRH